MNVLYSYIPPVDVIQTLKRERERKKIPQIVTLAPLK